MNFNEPFILFSYPIISSHLGVSFFFSQVPLWLLLHGSHLGISEAIFAISPKQAFGLICSGRCNWSEFNWKSPHNTIHVLSVIAGLIFINMNSAFQKSHASRATKLSAWIPAELPWVRLQNSSFSVKIAELLLSHLGRVQIKCRALEGKFRHESKSSCKSNQVFPCSLKWHSVCTHSF